jgi:hypothetical protein
MKRIALKFAAWIVLGIGLACIGDIAFSQPASQPAVDPKATGDALLKLVEVLGAGKYLLAIGTVITLLTRLFTYISDTLNPGWLPAWVRPWVAAGLGVAGSVVAVLIAGGDWPSALVTGFMTGSAASGLWSLVAKHALVNKKTKADRAEARRLARRGK